MPSAFDCFGCRYCDGHKSLETVRSNIDFMVFPLRLNWIWKEIKSIVKIEVAIKWISSIAATSAVAKSFGGQFKRISGEDGIDSDYSGKLRLLVSRPWTGWIISRFAASFAYLPGNFVCIEFPCFRLGAPNLAFYVNRNWIHLNRFQVDVVESLFLTNKT